MNTLVRAARALALVLVFAEAASAQTTLNFVQSFESGKVVGIVNPSTNFADVQFTFYKPDGSLPSANLPLNPVSYQIPPKGRIGMTVADLFGGTPAAGWIQATSSTPGLGGQTADSFTDQLVPLHGAGSGTPIQLTNIGAQTVAAVKFYDLLGREIQSPSGNSWILTTHSQQVIPIPSGSASAHISSGSPVVATVLTTIAGASVSIHGQSATQTSEISVLPFLRNGSGNSVLKLTNPSPDPISVSVMYKGEAGNSVPVPVNEIPGNGSVDVNVTRFAPYGGYLQVDSKNRPLATLMLLNSGGAAIAVPELSDPADRFLFSAASTTSTMSLINPTADPVQVELSYINADGTTASQKTVPLTGGRTFSIRDIISPSGNLDGGFVAIRSNGAKLYAMELLGNSQPVIVAPHAVAPAFSVNPIMLLPGWVGAIKRYGTGNIHPGDAVTGSAKNVGIDLAVICGGKPVDGLESGADPNSPGNVMLRFLMPQFEPGFVSCKLKSNGMDSDAVRVALMDAAETLTDSLSGQAFYQKVEVTDNGLDLDRTSFKPIRGARIEVLDNASGKVLSVSDPDINGRFVVLVPANATSLVIRAVSRLRSVELKVEDNTNANNFYFILSAELDMRERPASVAVVDRTRRSGAFNILEQIQRSNDYVRAADPQFAEFPFTIFWSEKNQKQYGSVKDGMVGSTVFIPYSGIAYVLGDRNSDSDEYDDSVLIHEYAHALAVKFSHDDSMGGVHKTGDKLDPRVAWSEGWANFFSGAVRNDSIYRDSTGPGGANVLRFDLDENYPANSWIGYGSETSVQALLWDFLDDRSEALDSIQFDFSQIWAAFTDLKNDRFVYLPYFLDHLIAHNSTVAESIQRMAQAQGIDFQPGMIPSVSNPFPSVIAMNSTRPGTLDSASSRRTNLTESSHFFVFKTDGRPVSIQLNVALGPLNNPSANDLDLYLFDASGKLIGKSDSGGNGQPESFSSVPLPPGSYVIEVRSYYVNVKGTMVYNSGRYSLSLYRQ